MLGNRPFKFVIVNHVVRRDLFYEMYWSRFKFAKAPFDSNNDAFERGLSEVGLRPIFRFWMTNLQLRIFGLDNCKKKGINMHKLICFAVTTVNRMTLQTRWHIITMAGITIVLDYPLLHGVFANKLLNIQHNWYKWKIREWSMVKISI